MCVYMHIYVCIYVYVYYVYIYTLIYDLPKIFLALDPPERDYCPSWEQSVDSFESCYKMFGYVLFRAAEIVIIFIEFTSMPLWINTDYRKMVALKWNSHGF